MLAYLRLEVLRVLRNRRFVFFALAMPVLFYLLFTHLNTVSEADRAAWSRYFMASMATYSAMLAAVSMGSARLATERSSGWVRQLRATPMPANGYLTAKLLAAMAVALPSVLLLAALGATNGVRLSAAEWLSFILLVWLGTIPFAALGILLGYVLDKDSAQGASTILLLLLAFAGGLWTPIEILPHGVQVVAKVLPTYRQAELGWNAVGGQAPSGTGVAVLAGWTLVFAVLAGWRYRAGGERA